MTTREDTVGRRVRRNPHLLCTWQGDGRVVRSARRPSAVPASPLVLDLLDRLAAWTDVDVLAAQLDVPTPALSMLLDALLAHDLVEEHPPTGAADEGPATPDPWAPWSPTAYLFHVATRDETFTPRPAPRLPAVAGPRPPVVLPARSGPSVPLPLPRLGEASLAQALRDRRTHRHFGGGGVGAQHLGTLLGSTFGVQAWAHAEEGPLALKTSPSGGARHSLEAYAWVRHVEGVPAGLYHYRPDRHVLESLANDAPPDHVTRWLPQQDGYEGAAVVVAMASVLARVAWRYRTARAYRVVLLEAGHLAQTFCLTATALGLAPFCTGALADSAIERDLGLDGIGQPVFYVVGAGRRAEGEWRPHADRPAPRLEVTDLGRAL